MESSILLNSIFLVVAGYVNYYFFRRLFPNTNKVVGIAVVCGIILIYSYLYIGQK